MHKITSLDELFSLIAEKGVSALDVIQIVKADPEKKELTIVFNKSQSDIDSENKEQIQSLIDETIDNNELVLSGKKRNVTFCFSDAAMFKTKVIIPVAVEIGEKYLNEIANLAHYNNFIQQSLVPDVMSIDETRVDID